MYAIVDIETTGGYAAANDITEIAIVLHDGQGVTEVYQTLIKPSVPIPYFIQSLTGIHPLMLEDAPGFGEVAGQIHEMLQGRIFVAGEWVTPGRRVNVQDPAAAGKPQT